MNSYWKIKGSNKYSLNFFLQNKWMYNFGTLISTINIFVDRSCRFFFIEHRDSGFLDANIFGTVFINIYILFGCKADVYNALSGRFESLYRVPSDHQSRYSQRTHRGHVHSEVNRAGHSPLSALKRT